MERRYKSKMLSQTLCLQLQSNAAFEQVSITRDPEVVFRNLQTASTLKLKLCSWVCGEVFLGRGSRVGGPDPKTVKKLVLYSNNITTT